MSERSTSERRRRPAPPDTMGRGLFDFEHPDFEVDGRDWPNREASRFVTAGGLTWHVQDWRGPREDAPVLLLVHGTGAATHSWRDLAPLLARDFRVIAPDLPGHGFSGPVANSELSLPAMARALAALLESLGVRPVLAVGHSAGAAILIRMALDATLAPRAIIGINAALMPFRGLAQHLFPPIAKLLVLNPVVPRMFAWGTDLRSVDRLIERTGSRIDRVGLEAYRRLVARSGHVAAALGMMARWDLDPLVAALPRLETRLDLIISEGDKAVPPDDAVQIRRKRPATGLIRLPRLGHLAHEEDPKLVAGHILRIARETGVLA